MEETGHGAASQLHFPRRAPVDTGQLRGRRTPWGPVSLHGKGDIELFPHLARHSLLSSLARRPSLCLAKLSRLSGPLEFVGNKFKRYQSLVIHLVQAHLWDCGCVHTCPPASVSRYHQWSSRVSLKWSLGATVSNQMFLSTLSCLTLGAQTADGRGGICREVEMCLTDLLNLRNKGRAKENQHLCGGTQLSSQG